MARIPRLMIYYKGERLVTMHVFSLPAPELAVAFSDDYTSCTVDVANRDAMTVYHYTLDGSEPDKTSPVLSGALVFDDEFTINVKAYRAGEESTIYTLEVVRTATPVTTLTSTEDGGEVEIACDTDGARIEYGIKPPTVTLHNMMTKDTSTAKNYSNGGVYDTVDLSYGHNYYIRGTFAGATEGQSALGVIWKASPSIYNDPNVVNLQSGGLEYNVKQTWATIFTPKAEGPHNIFIQTYSATTYSAEKCLLIDLTDLYARFPSFAQLSTTEQKEILDTLPYFFGDFELGGELMNVVPDESTSKSVTFEAGYSSYANCMASCPEAHGDGIFYSRLHVMASRDVMEGEYDYLIFDRPLGIMLAGKTYINPIAQYLGEGKEVSQVGKVGYPNSIGIFFSTPQYTLQDELTIGFKKAMLFNLTATGHYTLFRLMGLDDNAIKTMLDAMPFFEDSYQGDVVLWQDYVEPFEIDGPRTILARAYKDGMFVSDVASTPFERVVTPLIEADWTEE